ncbi:hypothetical protein BSAG_04931 [Bacteroides sp. D1]|nr:hypothetical protein BSAG_04931 [Bacteroides sp. D1]
MYGVKYQYDEAFFFERMSSVLGLCNSEKFYLEDEC